MRVGREAERHTDPHDGEGWQPLRDLGFDDQACLEVAHVVGLFNYFTRLADGFGLQVDPMLLAAANGGPALRQEG